MEAQPQRKVGNAGILAFKDKFASLSQDKVVPRLGADARYSAADDVGPAIVTLRVDDQCAGIERRHQRRLAEPQRRRRWRRRRRRQRWRRSAAAVAVAAAEADCRACR